MNRRNFLSALVAAPAIVSAHNIMRVKPLVVPDARIILPFGVEGDDLLFGHSEVEWVKLTDDEYFGEAQKAIDMVKSKAEKPNTVRVERGSPYYDRLVGVSLI